MRAMATALLGVTIGAMVGAEDVVTLTMAERAGVARRGEWITFGVPLPRGKVATPEAFALVQNGRVIPAEILPVTRWRDDSSLRWVHLLFQSDCPAGGAASVTITRSGVRAVARKLIELTEETDLFRVNTGPLLFEVRKRGFNCIHAAAVDGQPIVAPHDRGLGVRVGGVEYLAALDPEGTVTVEVPTLIQREGICFFGTEDMKTVHGRLAPDGEAYVYQSSSSEHSFGGAVTGRGGGKEKKSATIGWGDLSDGKTGMAAGVKWFWQLHPKSVEFTGDGLVRIGIYPQRHPEPLKIYTGVARTHELRLVFHSGPGRPEELNGVFAGLQKPLYPCASPRWYCRETKSLGDYCEAGGSELYGVFADKVKTFDAAFEVANRRSQRFRDERILKGVRTDSYGFLGFGDGVHWVWTANVDVPENISWAGNYYGYPHTMCVQFIRTGNLEYFENFEAHALHVADVHTVNYTEKEEIIGG